MNRITLKISPDTVIVDAGFPGVMLYVPGYRPRIKHSISIDEAVASYLEDIRAASGDFVAIDNVLVIDHEYYEYRRMK